MSAIVAAYADGGVIGRNPSSDGGTWAYCLVDAQGQRVVEESGVLTPAEAKVWQVSNNVTELYALVRCLEALPHGWVGTVHSDSWVTLQRVFCAAKLNNVPRWLVWRLQDLQESGRLATMRYVLLDGHPTRAQLAVGIGKRGQPVSPHNVWCDQACNAAKAQAQR